MAGIFNSLGVSRYFGAAFPITQPDLSRIIGPRLQRGTKASYGRRIIRTKRWGDRIYELHATKGWRSYRATNHNTTRGTHEQG